MANKKDKDKDLNLHRAFERAAAFHPNFFPAEVGIDAQKYHRGEPASYAAANFFAEQGGIHGVHAHVVPAKNGESLRIEIDHWVHRPDGENVLTRFLELEAAQETDAKGSTTVVVKKSDASRRTT